MNGLSEIIRTYRKKQKLTQLSLAMRLGVTPQAVGKWERGESEPDLTLLCPLAKELNVTLETLFGLEEKRGYTECGFRAEELRGNLKARRVAAGLTQAELAAKLGLRAQTVSKWETGICAPDLDYCSKLCALYSVTPTALFSERPPAPAEKPHHAAAEESVPARTYAAAQPQTAVRAKKPNFFTGKPLRLVALLLTIALAVTAAFTPLLFGGTASAPVLDDTTQTDDGEGETPPDTGETDPPDEKPDPDEGEEPPETGETDPPDEGEEEPPDEGEKEPPVALNYCTLTFYDGLTGTAPADNGVFGTGEVPEGTVLVVEEQPDQTPSRSIVGYYDDEECYEFGGLGSTRFDDYISHGCFDEKGAPYSFPLTVTEDTSFYMTAEPLWIDYFAYDSYAEQTTAQEICNILRGACENLLKLINLYEDVAEYEQLYPEKSRSILLGWAGAPPETLEIFVGESEERVFIPWINGDLPTLRERLALLAKTDPQTAERIRKLVNEQYILPQAHFFYAIANEQIPLTQAAAALTLFSGFAATMPYFHASAYAAFFERNADLPALALPEIKPGVQCLV